VKVKGLPEGLKRISNDHEHEERWKQMIQTIETEDM
jgi:hypothetical protein